MVPNPNPKCREVAMELLRGMIPKSWLQYKVSGDMTAALWVADFSRRVQQLERVVGLVSGGGRSGGGGALKASTFWLGGLFTPEAFITATRQCVAQVGRSRWRITCEYTDMR